jgi:hypothetical protein
MHAQETPRSHGRRFVSALGIARQVEVFSRHSFAGSLARGDPRSACTKVARPRQAKIILGKRSAPARNRLGCRTS